MRRRSLAGLSILQFDRSMYSTFPYTYERGAINLTCRKFRAGVECVAVSDVTQDAWCHCLIERRENEDAGT